MIWRLIRVILMGFGASFLALLLGAVIVGLDNIPMAIMILSMLAGVTLGIGMDIESISIND